MTRKTIKDKRLELNMSQEEVAKKSGIKYSTYVKKERGERKWLYNEVFKICHKAFNCSIDDIQP